MRFRTQSLAGALLLAALPFAASCQSSESHRTLAVETVATYGTNYTGPRASLSLGRFNNASPFLRGIFSDGQDRLGGQARTILKTHLSQTGRFELLDRENLEAMEQEAGFSGERTDIASARYIVSGQVTEFGRKTTGDQQLFGILGRGKRQVAESKVSVNVIDARTSKVVHSIQGAGQYTLSDREILGFGTGSGYDSTLNGKVLNLAITDAVNKLVADMESGVWAPVSL